jgi:hypothetical protein
MGRFIHDRDGVIVKEDVIAMKGRELAVSFGDREFRLVVLNFHRQWKRQVAYRFHSINVDPTELEALWPRGGDDMRKTLNQKIQ